MNKSELVETIAQRTGVSASNVNATLNGLFEVVAGVVAKGDEKVTIPGFIAFEQTTRKARTGRNPQTGEAIHVPESKAVKISAGSKLKSIAKGETAAP
ncbi:MAG: DNA-binding protein HB1 [Acidimicrobiales bacterium]|nr:MAG: integration host factor [Actinomycetota bacterium]MBV6509546.1 DNA-binding protein HB1 [Acidimicrobiales bacterium]RIK06590.1 MAG: integration host factor [Acidobacteriota bacterium]